MLGPLFLAAAGLSLVAARTGKPVLLDGKLDDAAWQDARASDAFTQKAPVPGGPPVERTTVRILYDHEHVYVGVACVQTRAPVIGRLTRRDRSAEADSVTVTLDTRGDGRTALEFGVNVAGVLSDKLRFNDTESSSDWDENWEAKTARTPTGWSAELRIPLRILRFSDRPVQSWGLQVRRYVSARQETDEWAYIPPETAGEVSHYGRLDGLGDLRAGAPLELRPFVVGSLRHHDPQASTLARGFEPGFSLGLDLKWHIHQALTLDAAFFPDFAQVELDQAVLNLTNFETYYPEKRPFFLEGVDLFATPLELLYTRRIGRAPAAPALLPGEELVRSPHPSAIYGAAKLTGNLGHGISVGGLLAVTEQQSVEVEGQGGARWQRLADPLTTYKVLRLKLPVGSNADVGVIASATNRLEPTSDYPALPGGPARRLCPGGEQVAAGRRCFHDAYAAGVDGRWRSASGDYAASGQVIATIIDKGQARTLRDGTTIQSGDAGVASRVWIAKEGGRNWTGSLTYEVDSREVDYNDLGFMKRQNRHDLAAFLQYQTLEPMGPTLRTATRLDFYETDNLDGLNLDRWLQISTSIRFKSFWSMYAYLHTRPRVYDDREMGDGAALEHAALFGCALGLESDPRRVVSAGFSTKLSVLENGGSAEGSGHVSVRALPQWDVDLLPTWSYTSGEPRYLATHGERYLFGRQRAASLGATLRSTYTFTPELSLQAYAQLFFDSEQYSDILSSPSGGKGAVVHLSDLAPATAPETIRLDRRSGTFNASLALRWEYRLGSTLYVVYTHAQSRRATSMAGARGLFDLDLAAPGPAGDAVLAKLSFWWPWNIGR